MFSKAVKNFIKKILPESFILSLWHYPKAVLACLCYNFPARKLTVIGVAGTKGKTTTCHLVSQILEKAGKRVAMISSAILKINQEEGLNKIKMATPPPFFLQKFIKKASQSDCQYLVLETSSHALVQHRTFGIPFKIMVLTNMMPDHLDYHKTAQAYSRSHQKMISSRVQHLILNGDDPNLKEFLKLPLFSGQKIIYSLENKKTIFAKDIYLDLVGSSFVVETPQGSIQINLPLLGKFNIYNSLAALSVAFSQNINLETAKRALEKFRGVPGRMEKIDQGQDFEVIVDYAHSPDSLTSLFEVVSSLRKKKVITVFGACGDRDEKVRPAMGQILDQNSDYIVVTNDDPYNEEPEKIAKQLLSGIKNKTFNQELWKILDRKLAIEKAISLAQKDDLVLILGKGAEQWQIFKDKKIPWDDRKVTREILQKIIQNPVRGSQVRVELQREQTSNGVNKNEPR
jgi:UDP-N-acetylmuramoyl-L-alanyl-D-glutamate--2,6-diaminopimelate ligase